MYPMNILAGTDDLEVGKTYVINISGTSRVWTAVKNDVYLRDYDPDDKMQLFRATLDDKKRWGFYSDAYGKRVGRNRYENVKCEYDYDTQGSWECFVAIEEVEPGARRFYMTVYDEHRPLRKIMTYYGDYFTIQEEGEHVTFGLTKIDIWYVQEAAFTSNLMGSWIDSAISRLYGLPIGLSIGTPLNK
ncbi:hypothetical protein CVT25_005566 [Psilocybe cyanescens]|uniref:Uncharacterized protein n=1 Tax=Psilocybe cyanescens TaxID=93625 RepID=A0A409XS91_PSICY|nr:hypothetical protein CVT25_005566 [Psilocybe cyanescens]